MRSALLALDRTADEPRRRVRGDGDDRSRPRRIVSDFHEIYWTKRSGEFAYARDSRIVLTIREGRIARYEMRFAG